MPQTWKNMIYTLAQTTHAHHTHLKTTPTPVSANPCTTHMRAHKAPNNASNKDKTKRATRTQHTTTNTDTQRKKRPPRKAYSSEHCNKRVLAMIINVPVHQDRRHKRDKKRGTSEKKTEAQARCRPSPMLKSIWSFKMAVFSNRFKITFVKAWIKGILGVFPY